LEVSTLDSIARTKAAVLPVPDCDWAIMFCGGSASNVGSAVSWILLGALNPMAYTPYFKRLTLMTPYKQNVPQCMVT